MTKEHIIFYSVAAAALVAGGLGIWGYNRATSKAEAKLGVTHYKIEKGYEAIDAALNRAFASPRDSADDLLYISKIGDTYKDIHSYSKENSNFFENQLKESADKLSKYADKALLDFAKHVNRDSLGNALNDVYKKLDQQKGTL